MQQFQTIFFHTDGVWIGFAKDLPGAITQGKTLQEAKENLPEAIEMVLTALHEQNNQFLPSGVQVYEETMQLEIA